MFFFFGFFFFASISSIHLTTLIPIFWLIPSFKKFNLSLYLVQFILTYLSCLVSHRFLSFFFYFSIFPFVLFSFIIYFIYNFKFITWFLLYIYSYRFHFFLRSFISKYINRYKIIHNTAVDKIGVFTIYRTLNHYLCLMTYVQWSYVNLIARLEFELTIMSLSITLPTKPRGHSLYIDRSIYLYIIIFKSNIIMNTNRRIFKNKNINLSTIANIS